MATGNNFTSMDADLKEYYSDGEIANEIYTDNPFLGIIAKNEKVGGRHFVSPLIYSAGQGRSGDFSQSQKLAGLSGELIVDFLCNKVENFATANVDNKTIASTKGDRNAFMDAVTMIADDQLQNLANDLSMGLYRSSAGDRGNIATATNLSSNLLQLTNPKDALNMAVGMELVVSATQTGSIRALGSASHGLYVIAVDRVAGTVSVGLLPQPGATPVNLNDATNGCPTIASGDFIFVQGDGTANTGSNLKLSGFQSWIPYGGVASSDSFFSVNRFPDPARLAGLYLDGTSSGTLEEVLEQADSNVCEQGGRLTHFFMAPKKFRDLSVSLGAKQVIVDEPSTAQVGYKGITVMGQKGPVTCLADRSCPSTMIAGINKADWELVSSGPAAGVWDEDGKVWLRSATLAGMEIRFYSLAQVVCKKPVSQINIKVSA